MMDCTGLYWAGLGSAMLGCTGLYWAVLVCIEWLSWPILGHTGLHWTILVCIRLCWDVLVMLVEAVLVCTGLHCTA